MIKNKYQGSDKKKKAKEEFFKTEIGENIKKRLNRLLVYSIILLLFSCYLLIDAVINDFTAQLIYGSVTLLASFAFFFGRQYIIHKQVNAYIIKKKTKK